MAEPSRRTPPASPAAPAAAPAAGPVPAPSEPLDRLAAACYDELRAIARRERRRGAGAVTLDTAGVLHEAFLRLAEQRQTRWDDRSRFLAAAAGMMRRVLVDHVRRRRAAKRGGARRPVTLDEAVGVVDVRDDALLALDEALTRLADLEPRLARVVECRYFAGMTEVETAEALGVTERTVRRDWVKARGWLHAALEEGG
jgi:RNA polymerase sigma factor (TIGR02999 family)